jgi:hypothetical protein
MDEDHIRGWLVLPLLLDGSIHRGRLGILAGLEGVVQVAGLQDMSADLEASP